MIKKPILRNKLILIIIGIGSAFLIIEICLSISSFVLLKNRHAVNLRQKNKDQVKILCLGDSFTYGLNVKKEQSFPYQLEEILNEQNQNKQFIVFNQGIPGTNSSSLAYNLRKNIDSINPDIIIVLIGNNDWGVFDHVNSSFSPRSLPFYKRIISDLRKNLFSKNNQQTKVLPVKKNQSSPGILDLIKKGNQLRAEQKYDQAIEYHRKASNLAPMNNQASLELLRSLKFAKRFQEAVNLALDQLSTSQANLEIYIELANVFQIISDGWSFLEYPSIWQKNNPDQNLIIPNAARLQNSSKPKLQILLKKAYKLYNLHAYDSAFACYQEIYELFNSRLIFREEFFLKCPEQIKHELLNMIIYGIADALLNENISYIRKTCAAEHIQLIVLSYPEYLTPLANTDNLTVLDLKPDFIPYSKPPQRDKYFQTSKHCTALGNKLIAEHIAAYITFNPNYKNLTKKQE